MAEFVSEDAVGRAASFLPDDVEVTLKAGSDVVDGLDEIGVVETGWFAFPEVSDEGGVVCDKHSRLPSESVGPPDQR